MILTIFATTLATRAFALKNRVRQNHDLIIYTKYENDIKHAMLSTEERIFKPESRRNHT